MQFIVSLHVDRYLGVIAMVPTIFISVQIQIPTMSVLRILDIRMIILIMKEEHQRLILFLQVHTFLQQLKLKYLRNLNNSYFDSKRNLKG